MIDGLWQWVLSDYSDEERKNLVHREVDGEPFRPTDQALPLWVDPTHVGASQAKEVTKIVLPDGTLVYRALEVTRVS